MAAALNALALDALHWNRLSLLAHDLFRANLDARLLGIAPDDCDKVAVVVQQIGADRINSVFDNGTRGFGKELLGLVSNLNEMTNASGAQCLIDPSSLGTLRSCMGGRRELGSGSSRWPSHSRARKSPTPLQQENDGMPANHLDTLAGLPQKEEVLEYCCKANREKRLIKLLRTCSLHLDRADELQRVIIQLLHDVGEEREAGAFPVEQQHRVSSFEELLGALRPPRPTGKVVNEAHRVRLQWHGGASGGDERNRSARLPSGLCEPVHAAPQLAQISRAQLHRAGEEPASSDSIAAASAS
eukprot:CAMPEP_0179056534 /NCGR_PEP_ID=MMETSP0796-20121207/23860_1 /TAXON_ID=73915 /ORGANISM="Pyrodinium bahamense, Strain pbaha01" /LENGTH=299 /DNA_ID=CAMNT_0020753209 /DNA_START=180 /DNA_END=1083 /DNA_ORIENTATION=-